MYIIYYCIAAKSMRVSLMKIAPIKADESLVRAELLVLFVGGDESLMMCDIFSLLCCSQLPSKITAQFQTLARHDHFYLRIYLLEGFTTNELQSVIERFICTDNLDCFSTSFAEGISLCKSDNSKHFQKRC